MSAVTPLGGYIVLKRAPRSKRLLSWGAVAEFATLAEAQAEAERWTAEDPEWPATVWSLCGGALPQPRNRIDIEGVTP